MSKDISIQIQHPNTTIEFNNPSITIEVPDHSTQIEFQEGQPLEIQVMHPNIVVELGCQCGSGSGSGGHTIIDETTPLPQRSKLRFTGSGVTATDDSGNDTTVVTIPGGGGGAGITEITYADAQTAIAGSALTPGAFYNITDAAGTDGGFVCVAVAENAFSVRGAGMFGSEFNAVEFNFANNQLIYRSDLIGNVVRGADAVAAFPWGFSNVSGNTVNNGLFLITVNPNATYRNNTIYPGGTVTDSVVGDGTAFENNIIENGGQITGITAGSNCSISRNKVGQGAVLGGGTTMGDSSEISDNLQGPVSIIGNISMGSGSYVKSNNIYNNSRIEFIEMGDGSYLSGNIIKSNKGIQNKTIASGTAFNNASINIDLDAPGPLEGFFDGLVQPGYSNISTQADISASATLDCLAQNQHVGIYNLTSSNASEALDTIVNFPTQFPMILKPEGFSLTITGTAIGGIAAGQIALKAASYTLDGSKGEYIILEADPTNTYLVEKQVVNGLI